jgi:hypothetical protein
MVIAIESLVLAVICAVDLLSTLWLVGAGQATEANPVMAYYINTGGAVAFTGAKILLFGGPLFTLEVLRRRKPQFIRTMLRAAVVLYLVVYCVGVWRVNM